MRVFYLALIACAFVLALNLIQLVLLRVLNTIWWRRRPIKLASIFLVVANVITAGLWLYGTRYHALTVAKIGATATALIAVVALALVVSFSISGILNTIQYWVIKIRTKRLTMLNSKPQSVERRMVLEKIAAVVPISAVAISTVGMTRSFSDCDVREVPFYYSDLPVELDDFRILHISDTHLGPYIDLDDLEVLMLNAEKFSPDLLLISGDIADQLDMLPDAVTLFQGLKAPYGAYACMGNHDYYRGERHVRKALENGSIPMLTNAGVTLRVGSTDLFIGGADDPLIMGANYSGFMRKTVDSTFDAATSDSFKILMSHRPSGFDRAAQLGVDLTVAGHTHGGQIGFMGRSVFPMWGGERYTWGKYQIGASQAYVSSGVGHWFPFRLGCPTEAPVLVLKRQADSRTGLSETCQKLAVSTHTM